MPEQSEDNNHTSEINIFPVLHTIFCPLRGQKMKIFFLLSGHKVDFIAPCGSNKSIFWSPRRKIIVCDTVKIFISLVWLLSSLCSGIKIHTCKIHFSFPQCYENILCERRNGLIPLYEGYPKSIRPAFISSRQSARLAFAEYERNQ